MQVLLRLTWNLKIYRDNRGQELVEYALIAGFLACACGATLPDIGSSVLFVFNQVLSVLSPVADGTGASPTS